MPEIKDTAVKNLSLDLKNFRTVPQANELEAVQAMISISPDYFWALTTSLLDDGYLPTENIVVLKDGASHLRVCEGNRRIAALKLAHGYISSKIFDVPEDVENKILALTPQWKRDNAQIPCAVYERSESDVVDKIVTLIHGKGDKASRERWEAVARARHNRDKLDASEPALDLLEKFLASGRNVTTDQKKRWAGSYPITVLDEAIKKSSKRFGASNGPDLVDLYPTIKYRSRLDEIMKNIGLEQLGFKQLRDSQNDFLEDYGFAPEEEKPTVTDSSSSADGTQAGSAKPTRVRSKKTRAASSNDPRSVMRTLRTLAPVGNSRKKIVSLRDEALRLKLDRTPMAFCFLLRSMFEISAKIYCDAHKRTGGLSTLDTNGRDKTLKKLLGDVTKHLTADNADKEMVKKLHGAKTELGKSDGILSVTSMNQLVHNPSFTTNASDISSIFGNIFPLLQAMNE
ncbi:MAG TPA: hypothetical protein VGO34_15755 [Alphaproteobacteria bacterium]|jgi:hypothetical protein